MRVVFGKSGAMDVPDTTSLSVEMVTIGVGAEFKGCRTADPSVPSAFGKISGLAPEELDGAQFLVDQEGWIRALKRPGQESDTGAAASLLAALTEICTHPLGDSGKAHAHHHHQ